MYYSFIYTLLHFMVFIYFQSLFRSDSLAQWLLLELWYHIKCVTLEQKIYQQQMLGWKVSLITLPTTKMYRRYNRHTKHTWCFLYLFLQAMSCWNQIEETLYLHLWLCEQICCKILVQNSDYSFCSRHGLWLCKAIIQVSMNIDHIFLTDTKKCEGRNLSYT